MATYAELRPLFAADALKNLVEVACIVAAETIRGEPTDTPNHANRLLWAKAAFKRPGAIRDEMLMALLGANKDASVAAITSVSDTDLQARVDAAVDLFADGS